MAQGKMNTQEMIRELRKRGYKVEARKRTDGGWLITSINGKKFSGAAGNTEARGILGVELSTARQTQLISNVEEFIRGKKKEQALDPELKKKLRKVQAKWRKNKVRAKLTSKKVKRHVREEGKLAAERYLEKQTRYGEGLAYEENVEYLAQYIEDIAKGITDKELQEASIKTANYVRSKSEIFKDEWIHKIYEYWYAVRDSHYDPNVAAQAIMHTYAKIG